MREQILKQPRSTSDSILTISWRVHLVDVQAKPEKPLDSRYRLGTLIVEEEWYAEQTVIWHNGSKAREGKRVPAWHNSDGTSGPAAWGFHHAQEPETTTGLGSG